MTKKLKSSSKRQILKRTAQSTALTQLFEAAGRGLQNGDSESRPWEYAIAAPGRDTLRELAEQTARVRQERNLAFAQEIEQHDGDLSALDMERHQTKRAIPH